MGRPQLFASPRLKLRIPLPAFCEYLVTPWWCAAMSQPILRCCRHSTRGTVGRKDLAIKVSRTIIHNLSTSIVFAESLKADFLTPRVLFLVVNWSFGCFMSKIVWILVCVDGRRCSDLTKQVAKLGFASRGHPTASSRSRPGPKQGSEKRDTRGLDHALG